MEGNNILKISYDHICTLEKNNCTNSLTINYDKLDSITAGELKDAISMVLRKRKRDVYINLMGSKPYC